MGRKQREGETSEFRRPVERNREKLEQRNKFCGTSPPLMAAVTDSPVSVRPRSSKLLGLFHLDGRPGVSRAVGWGCLALTHTTACLLARRTGSLV